MYFHLHNQIYQVCMTALNILSWTAVQLGLSCYHLACKLSCDVYTTQVNSALHPSRVTKSSTSFIWGKGGKVTTTRWQVTLCDPTWHVISHSGEVIFDYERLYLLDLHNCLLTKYYLQCYYTVSEKTSIILFVHNSGKYWPNFKHFSLLDSAGNL